MVPLNTHGWGAFFMKTVYPPIQSPGTEEAEEGVLGQKNLFQGETPLIRETTVPHGS